MKNMNVLAKAITLGIMLSTPLLTYAESAIVNEDKAFVGDTTYDVPFDISDMDRIPILMNDGKEHTISVKDGNLTISGNPKSGNPVLQVTENDDGQKSTLNLNGNITLTNQRLGSLGAKIENATLNVDTLTINGIGKNPEKGIFVGLKITDGMITGNSSNKDAVLNVTVMDKTQYESKWDYKELKGINTSGNTTINTVNNIDVIGGGDVTGIEINGITTINGMTTIKIDGANGETVSGLSAINAVDEKPTLNMVGKLVIDIKNIENHAKGINLQNCNDKTSFNDIQITVDGGKGPEDNFSDENAPLNIGVYVEGTKSTFNGLTDLTVKNNKQSNHGLYITQYGDNNNQVYIPSDVSMEKANIKVTGGKKAVGVEVFNSIYKVDELKSTVTGESVTNNDTYGRKNVGVLVKQGQMTAGLVNIDVTGYEATGLKLGDDSSDVAPDITNNTTTIDNLIIASASKDAKNNYGIHAKSERDKLVVKNADITVSNTGDENKAFGIKGEWDYNMTFEESVAIDAKNAIYAVGNNTDKSSVINIKKNFASNETTDSIIAVKQDAIVHINSTGDGIVTYKGIIDNSGDIDEDDGYSHLSERSAGTINFNMNNADSYWNLTGSSWLNTLNIANGAKLDMTVDGGKFSTLHVKELTGSVAGAETDPKNIIKMDIKVDESGVKNDRVYVDGVHNGTHFIDIPVLDGANIDGAEGTVLVSVKDEKGEFKANDSEGQVFWEHYDLDKYETAKGDEVTNGYTTDWYVKDVSKVNKPTTGVDSVLSMNSLNYHTWRTENDKLLQRMGELRHNGEEEKGAWFRVKGSKIGYDGGFENKYTTYELGYDEVTKRTEDVVRYQGAALSYVDGKSSYNSGSGDNHGKSIGFYTTEQYSKGHYLDLVFKISNMDNDFKVFDTKGNAITGEYDNTGVSISAEYGRKNDLDHGWYIEPQAQLTLGYMGGASYETDNGISVDQSGIKSALGRIGFNIGKQIGERGIVYAKANLLHEFGGGYDVAMEAKDGSLTVSNTYNDTWFEYGLGVALATSDNSHIYFDVERSTGSDFYKDWQWNAGMRWNF